MANLNFLSIVLWFSTWKHLNGALRMHQVAHLKSWIRQISIPEKQLLFGRKFSPLLHDFSWKRGGVVPDTMVKRKVLKRMTGVFHSNLSKHAFLSLKILVCLAFRYLNFCISMFFIGIPWQKYNFSSLLYFFQGILDWVMDSTKRDNKEVEGKLMALQKEKDQVQQIAFPLRSKPNSLTID